MTKFRTLFLSFCLLLLASTCLPSSVDKFNECQLNNLNALEPDHSVEAEGGVIETWSSNHPELCCAGVSVAKRTLEPNGLHLPSYSPYPQMLMIVQGRGAIGLAIPGCGETFEEPQAQSKCSQQPQDSHQKIRHLREGHIMLIPPGVPYWSYNYADEPFVAVSLLDTSNDLNQLDQSPRVFYIGGNPGTEHPETLKQQGKLKPRYYKRAKEEEEEEGGSLLSGFGKHFIAKSLNTDEETAEQLVQSEEDERKQIVKVKEGLSVISPKWREGQKKEEEEEEEEDKSHQRKHGKEEEEEEEEDDESGHRRTTKWKKKKTRPKRREGEEGKEKEEEEEWEEKPSRRKGGGSECESGCENGLEETLCTARLHENIARASRADFYNPMAGRISTVNSLTLPALRLFQLSAQYVVLYKNGIYAPHWNLNSNSIMYVIRGSGRVRVVNCQGSLVFDDELRRGQLLVVPQNFAVSQEAGNEGFEYVVFKTSDRAVSTHMKQVFRAIPAEVLANAFGLRHNQVSQLKYSGNWGPLVNPTSPHRCSRDI